MIYGISNTSAGNISIGSGIFERKNLYIVTLAVGTGCPVIQLSCFGDTYDQMRCRQGR